MCMCDDHVSVRKAGEGAAEDQAHSQPVTQEVLDQQDDEAAKAQVAVQAHDAPCECTRH